MRSTIRSRGRVVPSASGPKAACVPTGQTPHPVLCCLLSHFISLIPRPRAFWGLQLGGRGAVLAKVRAARPVIQVHAWRHLPFGPSDAGTDGQYAASKNSVPVTGPGVDHYGHAQARAHAHSYTQVHACTCGAPHSVRVLGGLMDRTSTCKSASS